MGIGSVTSTNSMSGMQMLKTSATNPKIKKLQNEIADAKQQIQKLSPELSNNEKEIERKKLQKEISSLNTELKQHQEALRQSQKKEIRAAELQEDQEPSKEEKSEGKIHTNETSSDKTAEKDHPAGRQQPMSPGTVIASDSDGTVIFKGTTNQGETGNVAAEEKQAIESEEKDIAEKEPKTSDTDTAAETGLSHKKIYAIVSAGASVQQASRQGTVIANTRDGIAILKGEMNQDEIRGADTEKKQSELEKMEEREQRAIAFQSSILGEANRTMKSAAENKVTEINDKARVDANNNAYFNALRQEETQAAQQRFHVIWG